MLNNIKYGFQNYLFFLIYIIRYQFQLSAIKKRKKKKEIEINTQIRDFLQLN